MTERMRGGPAPRVGLNGRSAQPWRTNPLKITASSATCGRRRSSASTAPSIGSASHRSIHRACSPPSWTTRREADSRSRPKGKAFGRNSSIGRKPMCWSPAFSRRTVSENLIDFMPVGLPRESPWQDQLIRRVRVTRGTLAFRMRCHPAFDYARAPHRASIEEHGAVFESAVLNLGLASAVPLSCDGESVHATFALQEGEEAVFLLRPLKAGEERCRAPPTLKRRRCSNTRSITGTGGCPNAPIPAAGAKWCTDRR